MQGLLQQALHMQAQLVTAQDELAASQVEGSAGGGLVSAQMTGAGELVGLVIDPDAVDPDDTETLADLVLAAVRDATRAAKQLAEEKMGGVTAGMTAGLSIPGFGSAGPGVPGLDAPPPGNPAGHAAPPDLP